MARLSCPLKVLMSCCSKIQELWFISQCTMPAQPRACFKILVFLFAQKSLDKTKLGWAGSRAPVPYWPKTRRQRQNRDGCPKLCGSWEAVLPRWWFIARPEELVLTRTGDPSHVSWKGREKLGGNLPPIGRISMFCLEYVFPACLMLEIVFRTLNSEHSRLTSWLSEII